MLSLGKRDYIQNLIHFNSLAEQSTVPSTPFMSGQDSDNGTSDRTSNVCLAKHSPLYKQDKECCVQPRYVVCKQYSRGSPEDRQRQAVSRLCSA